MWACTNRCAEEPDFPALGTSRTVRNPVPTFFQGIYRAQKASLDKSQPRSTKTKADDRKKLNAAIVKHLLNLQHTSEAGSSN